MRKIHGFSAVFLIALTLLPSAHTQVCSHAPIVPALNPDEGPVDTAYKKVLADAAGCAKAGDPYCPNATVDLASLQSGALLRASASVGCADQGQQPAGTPLTVTDKAWYGKRSVFWLTLYQDMVSNAVTTANGTYKISTDFQDQYLGVVPAIVPMAPTLSHNVFAGISLLKGNAQAVDVAKFPSASKVYACVWGAKPAAPQSLDCTLAASATKPSPLSKSDGKDGAGNDYVLAKPDGSVHIELSIPLAIGQFVSLVEISTPAGSAPQAVTSATVTAVGPATQCNQHWATEPYSDCDLKLSVIAGVEQSAQSSLASETTPFLRVFTTVDPVPHFAIWGAVRLLGAPTTSSTQGVVSVVTDPTGALTTQTFSTIGTSVDYMVGAEYKIHKYDKPYTVSLIAGFGSTTPLQANTLALAFQAPSFGTVECAQILNPIRFASQFAEDHIIPGTATNFTGDTPSCLVNANSPTTKNGKQHMLLSTRLGSAIRTAQASSLRKSLVFGRSTAFWVPGTLHAAIPTLYI